VFLAETPASSRISLDRHPLRKVVSAGDLRPTVLHGSWITSPSRKQRGSEWGFIFTQTGRQWGQFHAASSTVRAANGVRPTRIDVREPDALRDAELGQGFEEHLELMADKM